MGETTTAKLLQPRNFLSMNIFLTGSAGHLARAEPCTDYTSALHSFTYGSKGLADKDNVAVYSRIIAPTCSEILVCSLSTDELKTSVRGSN